MADETAPQDVPAAPAVTDDTSTNEDTQDTDVELEDMEISEEELADDTEESEDSESEKQDTAPADEEESKVDEEQSDESNQESEESSDQESEEEDTVSEDEQKRRNDEFARQRIAEREARRRQEQEEAIRLDRYLQEAKDDETELAKRRLEVEAHLMQKERIALNEQSLQNGIDKAVANIDILRTGSPEVKEFLIDSLNEFEATRVVKDEYGNPVEIRGDVYEFLKAKAESAKRLAGVGARQSAQSKNKQKARTITPPSKTPKEPKVDPDVKDFDDSWDS